MTTVSGVRFLKEKLKNMSETAGVYRMINEAGKVIYVGKAKNLKRRVSSYFHKKPDSAKLLVMVPQIEKIEFIVTDSEVEALILESHLIKNINQNIMFF